MTNAKKATALTVAKEVKQVEILTPIVTEGQLYKTAKAIEMAIAKAVVAGNALQVEYQLIACSLMTHLHQHKDIRLIRNFLGSLPEGMRKKSMSVYFEKFAQVMFDDEGEVHFDKERKLDLAGALALGWWKAAKETPYIPVNLLYIQKYIQTLLNKIDKAAAKGEVVPTEVTLTLSNLDADLKVQIAKQDEAKQEAVAKAA